MSHSAIDTSVAFIGGGQMALALAEGFCRAGLVDAQRITVYDPSDVARERLAARVPGVRFAATGPGAAAAAPSVFLAGTPPQ
ncbi:MAG: NAD(P)-binding domain-containing protein, partial [Planctomycetia bacterium]